MLQSCSLLRRDSRVVEWGGLENRYTGNCIGGSNPSLSAKKQNALKISAFCVIVKSVSNFIIVFSVVLDCA